MYSLHTRNIHLNFQCNNIDLLQTVDQEHCADLCFPHLRTRLRFSARNDLLIGDERVQDLQSYNPPMSVLEARARSSGEHRILRIHPVTNEIRGKRRSSQGYYEDGCGVLCCLTVAHRR